MIGSFSSLSLISLSRISDQIAIKHEAINPMQIYRTMPSSTAFSPFDQDPFFDVNGGY